VGLYGRTVVYVGNEGSPPCPSRWSPISGFRRANRAAHGLASTSSAPPSLRFAEVEGFQIVAEHVEIETGKGSDALERRPQLAAALAEARRNGRACPVVVSKLERLSRDVHFISGLTAHRTPFLVADLGSDVEPLLLHLYAALAEKERAIISQRTKAALAAAKARGQALGNPRLAEARAAVNAIRAASRGRHVRRHRRACHCRGSGRQCQVAPPDRRGLERSWDRDGARGQVGSDSGAKYPSPSRMRAAATGSFRNPLAAMAGLAATGAAHRDQERPA
jgi:hypothetical protein